MSKPLINRIFVISLAGLIVGILLALVPVIAALCTGTWTYSGSELTGFELSSTATSLIGFAIVGGMFVVLGGLGQLIAWVGALVNTARLEDKVWFVILLLTGLLSFGFIAMLVYVLVGPDGTATPTRTSRPHGIQPA